AYHYLISPIYTHSHVRLTYPRPSLSLFILLIPPPPRSTLFPYTTLFRSKHATRPPIQTHLFRNARRCLVSNSPTTIAKPNIDARSEEHTSELQSLTNLVCRLLLEKKKKNKIQQNITRPSHVYIAHNM